MGSWQVFAIYGFNMHNVTHLPDGTAMRRTDELGEFVMKYSDDGGRSWSKERYLVPTRMTDVDKKNVPFKGKVKMFWCVDPSSVVNGTVYFAYTKIGSFLQAPPEEIFIMSSHNLLTTGVSNASAVAWRLLPDGDVGVLPPAVSGPGDRTQVMEEGHVVALNGGRGWYMVARGIQGFVAASHTQDPTAASGWESPAGYAQYYNPSAAPERIVPLSGYAAPSGAVSTGMKNSRGPITPKRLEYYSKDPTQPARYLLLFYNSAWEGYANRDPYWLTSGIEANGTVLWSQPEVGLYDRSIHTGTSGGGYPDLVQGHDGSISITCTTKYMSDPPPSEARVHKVDPHLLSLLLSQHKVADVAAGAIAEWLHGSPSSAVVPLMGSLPPAFDTLEQTMQGFAIDLVAYGFGNASSELHLVKGTGAHNASVHLFITTAGALQLDFASNDGSTTGGQFSFSTANCATCTRLLTTGGPSARHFVAVNVDAGPLLATVMVDGVLCDGGTGTGHNAPFNKVGWAWVDKDIGSLASVKSVSVSEATVSGHVYGRALFTSELVGNFRASRVHGIYQTL